MSLAKLIVLLMAPTLFAPDGVSAGLFEAPTCATLPVLEEASISKLALVASVIVLIVLGSLLEPAVVEANCCCCCFCFCCCIVSGELGRSAAGLLDAFLPLELLSNLRRNSKLPEALLLASSLSSIELTSRGLLPTAAVLSASLAVEPLEGLVVVEEEERSSGVLLFPA